MTSAPSWSQLLNGNSPVPHESDELTTPSHQTTTDLGFAFLAPLNARSPLALATWIPALGIIALVLALLPSVTTALLSIAVAVAVIACGVHAKGTNPSHLLIGEFAPGFGVVLGAASIILASLSIVFVMAGLR